MFLKLLLKQRNSRLLCVNLLLYISALYSNTNASEALFRKAKLPTLWFYVMLAKKLVIPTELRMADAVRTGKQCILIVVFFISLFSVLYRKHLYSV